MEKLQATNNFVLIIKDKADNEKNGLLIPPTGKVLPNTGKIFSVGDLVKDRRIKGGFGKKGYFPPGAGFEIEHEGQDYLVIESERIFGLI